MRLVSPALLLLLGLLACNDDAGNGPVDSLTGRDDAAVADSGASDGPKQTTEGLMHKLDGLIQTPDGTGDGSAEGGPAPDSLPAKDTLSPDVGAPDVGAPDVGAPDAPNTTGLTTPCAQGPGWTLFRFHYGGGGTSPTIDVWDATCSYSYAPNSACNVYAVYPGFGSVSYTSQGYPILTTSEYLRVRFSVAGLSFSNATVYIQARSYATASSTYYRVWSPIYGGVVAGPVDNDWVYDWYGLDWSGYLQPSDPPSLTAIQIYADQGSGQLAVKAVELCVHYRYAPPQETCHLPM